MIYSEVLALATKTPLTGLLTYCLTSYCRYRWVTKMLDFYLLVSFKNFGVPGRDIM